MKNNLEWKLEGSADTVFQTIKQACEMYGNITLKKFIEMQIGGNYELRGTVRES